MNLISRNVLSVFLASPGNLVTERNASRKVVDRINRILGKEIGLHIELLGWEDTLPGAGRPQSIINQDVEICDLFIGLLWKRWGSSTGKFSSGFEEEFNIAQSRYLDHQDEATKLEALKIIERWGDKSGLRALVDLAKSSHGELKTKSATLALKLASDYKEAVVPFLATEDTELVIQALEHIRNHDLRKGRRILEPLLDNKKDDIRKLALSYFIHKMRRHQLEEMLNHYLRRGMYYYNIVHWLDKVLYAPRIIRPQLLRRLNEE